MAQDVTPLLTALNLIGNVSIKGNLDEIKIELPDAPFYYGSYEQYYKAKVPFLDKTLDFEVKAQPNYVIIRIGAREFVLLGQYKVIAMGNDLYLIKSGSNASGVEPASNH